MQQREGGQAYYILIPQVSLVCGGEEDSIPRLNKEA